MFDDFSPYLINSKFHFTLNQYTMKKKERERFEELELNAGNTEISKNKSEFGGKELGAGRKNNKSKEQSAESEKKSLECIALSAKDLDASHEFSDVNIERCASTSLGTEICIEYLVMRGLDPDKILAEAKIFVEGLKVRYKV